MPVVLIVDDERPIRDALRRVLEGAGLVVREANSAEEALLLVRRTPAIEAVVTDVIMPGMSGLAFHDALVGLAPRLEGRIVFLSAAADVALLHAPVEERGAPLLSKLNDLRMVVDAVRLALAGKLIPLNP